MLEVYRTHGAMFGCRMGIRGAMPERERAAKSKDATDIALAAIQEALDSVDSVEERAYNPGYELAVSPEKSDPPQEAKPSILHDFRRKRRQLEDIWSNLSARER